ncbi:MAG: tellurite resistance TerB C-terminal domain-containing protein [Spirulinaceae cyanobacterium]
MRFSKPVNQLVLGSVAFGVSFGLGLFLQRDFAKALLTGIITVPSAYLGVIIAKQNRIRQEKQLRFHLYDEIQELEAEEVQIQQSLSAATEIIQEVEARNYALHTESNHLLSRVSELHNQRNTLYQELGYIQQQKQELETSLRQRQEQVQQLEKLGSEMTLSLTVRNGQIRELENRLNQSRGELERLRKQISEKQKQRNQINEYLHNLASYKKQLESGFNSPQTQTQTLVQEKEPQSQPIIKEEPENRESYIPKEWLEWQEFNLSLNEEQRSVFKAIVSGDEVALRQIADRQATMPEVLIESLNERALQVLGDTLFINSNKSFLPEVYSEYTASFFEPIQLSLKDFLYNQ